MTNADVDALVADFVSGIDEIKASIPPAADLASIYNEADDAHFSSREIAERRFYNWYAAYGALFRPRRILEIGVRRGYGALSLIRGANGATQSYLGIDSELDLPGQNERTRLLLVEHTSCSVQVLNADTLLHFPQLIPPYDLVHVDGNHSLVGAARDLLSVAPLVPPGGVIVVDDTDNPAVLQGVEIALAAFGQRVVRKEAGDVRRQVLLLVRRSIPRLDFSIAALLWKPDDQSQGSTLEIYRSLLRDAALHAAMHDEATVNQLFAEISGEYAKRFGVASPDRSGRSTVFETYSKLADELPDGSALIEEALPHVAYAAERLAGIKLPTVFKAYTPLTDAFEPGSSGYYSMTREVAANLAEILERRLQVVNARASRVLNSGDS